MDICARRWATSEISVDEDGASEAGGMDGSEWVAMVLKESVKVTINYTKLNKTIPSSVTRVDCGITTAVNSNETISGYDNKCCCRGGR